MRTEQVDVVADDFTTWLRPHWERMDRLARRLVGNDAAEDVLQESLAAAWRSRSRFDDAYGTPLSWLLAIVVNKARDHVRVRRYTSELDDVALPDEAPRRTDALDLTAALAQLTERRRVAVALHYYLGLSVDECAAAMSCSAGTVKSTLSDARAHLRTILGEEYR